VALAAIGYPTWRRDGSLVVSRVGGDHVRNLPHSNAMGNEQVESELIFSCVSLGFGLGVRELGTRSRCRYSSSFPPALGGSVCHCSRLGTYNKR
jgi:hypothetical protein